MFPQLANTAQFMAVLNVISGFSAPLQGWWWARDGPVMQALTGRLPGPSKLEIGRILEEFIFLYFFLKKVFHFGYISSLLFDSVGIVSVTVTLGARGS